MNLIYVACHIH